MGFGGAILALNRQNMLEERIQRERTRERRLDVLRRAMRFPYAAGARSIISRTLQSVSNRLPDFLGAGGTYDMNGEELVDAIAMSEAFDDWRDDGDLFGDDEGLVGALRRLHPEYKTIYTHPQPAAPGFTYDFAPSNLQPSAPEVISLEDDETGPSSSAAASASASSSSSDVSTSIVCAHCLDPLVLGATGSAEDQAQRKLWGLRCGHLLDGKCVQKLMQPPPEPQAGLEEGVDLKGKGKERDDSPQMPGAFVGGASGISEKARGKCRADFGTSDDISSEGSSLYSRFVESAEADSMRARLRPRNGAGHVQTASPSSSTTLQDNQAASRSHPLPGVRAARSLRAAKAKGKQKVALPRVEAEYEWCCPVPRCGKVHVSVKLEGQGWVMDESRGAISVFV
ncbi:hypothetical protein EWM64_g3360 [Hericium alpestre]|uniref:Uncharacterized protein n=1 Tax=Hericium alpestre TaxID=135208 RepID=A0A4Z0A0Q6_9AGAM|nr:hypothetical protein EWM64_g3360 [Hericium alpestre]